MPCPLATSRRRNSSRKVVASPRKCRGSDKEFTGDSLTSKAHAVPTTLHGLPWETTSCKLWFSCPAHQVVRLPVTMTTSLGREDDGHFWTRIGPWPFPSFPVDNAGIPSIVLESWESSPDWFPSSWPPLLLLGPRSLVSKNSVKRTLGTQNSKTVSWAPCSVCYRFLCKVF